MKKISIVLLLLLLFLSGCGNMSPYDKGPGIDLYYSIETLTYTNTRYDHILYQTGKVETDFFILYEQYKNESLTEVEIEKYQTLIGHLLTYQQSSGKSFETILNETSESLITDLSALEITPTIDDIVLFNQIKALIDEMKANDYSGYIDRITYIQTRLNRELTIEEQFAIEYLQDYYSRIASFDTNYLLTDTFEVFIERITALYGELDNETFNRLEVGFNIIKQLY